MALSLSSKSLWRGKEKKKETTKKSSRKPGGAQAAMYKHLIWGQQVAMITLLCLLPLPHPRKNNGSRSFDRSLGSFFLCCSSSLSMSCTTQPSTPEGKTHTEGEKSLMSDQIKLQQHKQYIMLPQSLNPIILPYLSLVLDFSSSIPRNAGSINKLKVQFVFRIPTLYLKWELSILPYRLEHLMLPDYKSTTKAWI